MRNIGILIVMMMSWCVAVSQPAEMLSRLDSVMAQSDRYERDKQFRIEDLRQRLSMSKSAEECYTVNAMLEEEFKTYNVDSARRYINAGLSMAIGMGDQRRVAAERVRLSFVLAAGGLLKEAQEAVAGIDVSLLDRDLRKEYYCQMMYLMNHLGDYAKTSDLGSGYYERAACYRDSIVSVLSADDADYDIFMGWKYAGTDGYEKRRVMDQIKTRLDNGLPEVRNDARAAYVMAWLSLEEGDTDGYIEYLARAAVGDVVSVNRDIASLEDLARQMYIDGDLDRANSYLNYALNAAHLYPNRVRTVALSELQRQINAALLERNLRQKARVRHILTAVVLLSIVLVVALVIIVRQMRKTRRYSRDLDSSNLRLSKSLSELSEAHSEVEAANRRLSDMNLELKRYVSDLSEANLVKEEYIGHAFSISSGYLSELKDFKKVVNRKCRAKQFDEIRALTESIKSSRDEMKDFYRSFDTVFLKIYPNFVSDFNSLLDPDARIYPRDGELLNTELRIFALIRLGISDSLKIAGFLHCSLQTVYNYRHSIRNKAAVDKEKFAEMVRSIGRNDR